MDTIPRPPADPREQAAWMRRESARRSAEEDGAARVELVPLGELPSRTGWLRDPDGTDPPPRGAGRVSPSLENLVAGCCNGWKEKPTAAEAERVMRSRIRGSREDSIAAAVITESSRWMIMEAEVDGAYSLQDAGWWIRELGIPCYGLIAWLNALSEAWVAEQAAARR